MTSPFAVTVHGTYTRSEVPPRCRKPRPVLYDTTATVTVESVSSSAAPVALRVTELRDDERAPSEIRTYQGRLYAPHESYYRQEGPTVPGDSRFPSEVTTHRYDHASSSEEFLAAIIDAYKPFLIIDGIVWAETSEPGYLVATFGIGGINGTTSLMVSDRTDYGTLFRADEFEAARAHAVEVSRDRGDRADQYEGEAAETYRAIEVLIPEAVTLVTVPPEPMEVRDLRFEYSTARNHLSRARTPDEETDAFEEVVRLREAIIRHGHAPLASEARPYEARGEHTNA